MKGARHLIQRRNAAHPKQSRVVRPLPEHSQLTLSLPLYRCRMSECKGQ